MPKPFMWIGVGLLVLVGLALLAAAGLYASASLRIGKTYLLAPEKVTIPMDANSISRGQRLVIARCAGCHGEDLSGTILFQDTNLGTISAANLTAGRGIGGDPLQDTDYISAIRHGINHNGRPILTMPSDSFYYINDQELGEMIAYLKSTHPVDHPLPTTHIKPLGIILIGAGAFGDLIAAEKIDHQAARPPRVETGVTVAYGQYLIQAGQCRTCHGQDLTGGKDPDPKAPPAPDLTLSGDLSHWTEAGFLQAIQNGRTPDGRQLNQYMPWMYIQQMTDDELKAMWLYLRTLPGKKK